jgi:hypothetical protein
VRLFGDSWPIQDDGLFPSPNLKISEAKIVGP